MAFAKYLLERVFGGANNELTDDMQDLIKAQWAKIDGQEDLIGPEINLLANDSVGQKLASDDTQLL